ncbi:MAG: indoleamine 2,3-dioxygenase [Pseudomonadota bacterium]
MRLRDFGISAQRGFLSVFDPADATFSGALAEIAETAMQLPDILPTGRVRAFLGQLPQMDLTEFCAEATLAEQRVAFVHYSFMVQAYVWGEPDAPTVLPANLAVPMWQLADATGQQPLLSYASYVLDNWGQHDPNAGFDLDNVFMRQKFLGGQDEAWFVLVHVAIEATAGQLLGQFPRLLQAAEHADNTTMLSALTDMGDTWVRINAIFDRMPERCDPYVYFHRVRPWIHGWKDNPALGAGLIYEGVASTDAQPQSFRGQTGSQSSIVPAMDAALGLGHADDPLRRYLDELHIYRPPAHREFIDALRTQSGVRNAVEHSGNSALIEAYNECVQALSRFRTRHLEYAATYINQQNRNAAGNAVDIGTGGTPFMKYLKKHRNETRAQLLRDQLQVAG